MRAFALLPALALALPACTPADDAPADTADTGADAPPRGDCNPLDSAHCLLPWPSSFFLADDATTGTGYRVAFGPGSLPMDQFGTQVRPDDWNRPDGFPILGNVYALLPGATLDGTLSFDALGAYAEADARTVLLDVETGERVPHYVEREAFTRDTSRAALVMHPAVPLRFGARYAVGIRGLVDDAGALVPAPDGFATLRDGGQTEDPDLERQRAGFEDTIFPALDAAGFAREDLQLAWDFVTVSADSSLATMRTIRDDGVAAWEAAGRPYTVDAVEDFDCTGSGTVGRKVRGTFPSPLFLDTHDPTGRLVRDDAGLPVASGTYDTAFTVVVPCSVVNDPGPSLLVQHGHGLFGSQRDVGASYLTRQAHDGRWILFATTYIGLSDDDAGPVSEMMASDPSDFGMIPDHLAQAHLDAILSAKLLRGPLADDDALKVGGVSVVDPDRLAYYGISMGSVLGGAQVAMSPEIDRALFQIPGAPFSALLTRSSAFSAFLMLLSAKYTDPVDVSLFVPLTEMQWDSVSAGGWMPYVLDGAEQGGLDGRQALLQVGIADDTVTSIGGGIFARSVGAGLTQPAPRSVWGVSDELDSGARAALTEFDYGYTENDVPAPQGLDPDPHWLVPSEAAAATETRTFFADGTFVHPCDGPCDPG